MEVLIMGWMAAGGVAIAAGLIARKYDQRRAIEEANELAAIRARAARLAASNIAEMKMRRLHDNADIRQILRTHWQNQIYGGY